MEIEETETPLLRHSEAIDSHVVDGIIDEVSRNLCVLEYGDSTFEIGIANQYISDDEVMLHISTYSSALSTNAGNLYEFAAQAARYPHKKHLYVASFGNGGTSPLLPADAAYARATGRFTRINEERKLVPIESIHNLHAALRRRGLAITEIMGTDSAGGHYARALSVAMESDQLKHAFFSEASGFVNLSTIELVYGMLIKELRNNTNENKELTPDPEKVDEHKIARAQAIRDRDEHLSLPDRQKLVAAKVGTIAQVRSMYTSLQALKRGPTTRGNPLVEDTNALLERHPNARITYALAEEDPLYSNPETCDQAILDFLGKIVVQKMPVEVIKILGHTHAYNTWFQSLYHALKRYAIEREN